MKKVDEFISKDQYGHVILTGGAVKEYFDENHPKTNAEKMDYIKGLMTVYPYIMLGNYHKWYFEDTKDTKDYQEFLASSQPKLSEKVLPILQKCYGASPISPEVRAADMTHLFTSIPYIILEDYYHWIDIKNGADFNEFKLENTPFSNVQGEVLLKAYYSTEPLLKTPEKCEIMIFFATQIPYMMLKRFYDWVYGVDMTGLPGGPGGPGPGGPGPGGPPPV